MWDAFASLAWTVLAAVILYKIWPVVNEILKRDGTTIKVGSLELTIPQATQNLGKSLADVQERLSKLEARLDTSIEEPVEAGKDGSGRKRLLWVDDYPSNNAFIVENLKERGIEVELSLSTEDALKRLEYGGFLAIITDLGRKEGRAENPYAGLDLIKAIRSRGNDVPILVFAGRRGLDNRSILLDAGAEQVTASGVEVNSFIEKYLA